MIGLITDIWLCLALSALLGVGAGWLAWGRHSAKVIESYRARLAKMRGNWESVDERLAEALERASLLERERDELQKALRDSQAVLSEKEEVWKQERRVLDETVRQLNERLVIKEANLRTPAAPTRSKRDLGQ